MSNPLRRIRREIAAEERLAPSSPAGHLYYVRLKTEFGQFYKLGFTKAGSVAERFSYGGSNYHESIDNEFLFVYLDDAYDVETRLHRHFSTKKSFGMFSAIPDMPLYRNGQGELYYADILKLDPNYTQFKHFCTWWRVTFHGAKKECGSGAIAFVLLLALFVAVSLLIAIVLPLSWVADWLNSDSGKRIKSSATKQVPPTHPDETSALITEVMAAARLQKSSRG